MKSGIWNVESGIGNVESGIWNRESGIWNVESGIWTSGFDPVCTCAPVQRNETEYKRISALHWKIVLEIEKKKIVKKTLRTLNLFLR